MPKDKFGFNTRNSSQSLKRIKDHTHKQGNNYYRDPRNFTHAQEKARERLLQRTVQFYYTPGSGNKKTALMLLGLILMGYYVDASNTITHNSNPTPNPKIKFRSPNEDNQIDRFERACNSTNIVSHNKPVGSVFASTPHPTIDTYTTRLVFPSGMPAKDIKRSFRQFQDNFDYDIMNRRNNVVNNLREKYISLINISRQNCTSPFSISNSSDQQLGQNIINNLIYAKFIAYSYIEDLHMREGSPVMANCGEITFQAALILLPELKKDQEYFVKVVARSIVTNDAHTYGLIVSHDILHGSAFKYFSREKELFQKKITMPFFNQGSAMINFNDQSSEKYSDMFWEGMGVNRKSKRIDRTSTDKVHLCDPYNAKSYNGYNGEESESYCRLTDCLTNKNIKDTYLYGYGEIEYIEIFTWDIPSSLDFMLTKEIQCLNDDLNALIKKLLDGIKNKVLSDYHKIGY